MITDEQIEQLRKLIAMMRDSGVRSFTVGEASVVLDETPTAPIELTSEDKLEILKNELKRASEDSDADAYWSV